MPSSRRALLLIVIALAASPAAVAQTCESAVTVSPANPTERTPVTISFVGFAENSCGSTLSHEIAGNVITIRNLIDCATQPRLELRHVNVGTLPGGTYEVRVFDHREPDILRACGSFTVADALDGIPTLTPTILLGLALAVAAAGVLALRMR